MVMVNFHSNKLNKMLITFPYVINWLNEPAMYFYFTCMTYSWRSVNTPLAWMGGCFIKQVYQTSQAYFNSLTYFEPNQLTTSQTNWNKPVLSGKLVLWIHIYMGKFGLFLACLPLRHIKCCFCYMWVKRVALLQHGKSFSVSSDNILHGHERRCKPLISFLKVRNMTK